MALSLNNLFQTVKNIATQTPSQLLSNIGKTFGGLIQDIKEPPVFTSQGPGLPGIRTIPQNTIERQRVLDAAGKRPQTPTSTFVPSVISPSQEALVELAKPAPTPQPTQQLAAGELGKGGIAPVKPYVPVAAPSGVSSGQFTGGGSGITEPTPGGAAALPSSLSNAGATIGGTPLITQEDIKKKPVKFIGSPDLFNPETGERLTEEQALALGAFQPGGFTELSTTRPGVTVESDFARLGGKALTSEELAAITPQRVEPTTENLDEGPAETDLGKLVQDLLASQREAVSTQEKDIAQKTVDDANRKLRDLELGKIIDIQDIVNDPDFSKTLQARRLAFLNNPQSEYWIKTIAAQNAVADAQNNLSRVSDRLNFERQAKQQDFSNSLALFNALKPDIKGTFTNANGDVYSLVTDPLTGKINPVKLPGLKGEANSKYTTPDVYGSAESGYGYIIQNKETGEITRGELTKPRPSTGGQSLTFIQSIQAQNQLEDNYRQNSAIKHYEGLVNSGVPQVLQAVNEGTSVDDLLLMRSLAKITDPTTGVREGEYDTFEEAQGWLMKTITGATKGSFGKGKLSSAGRELFRSELRNRFNAAQSEYATQRGYYENQATRINGQLPPPVGVSQKTTVTVGGKEVQVGSIIVNSRGQRGKVNADGTITLQ